MDKKSVLVIHEDGKRRNKLGKRLQRAFPHCSFTFEPTMRDASECTALVNYDLILLCARADENAERIRAKMDWLVDNCRWKNIILYDPWRRRERIKEFINPVRRKRWRWTQAIINAMRQYLPPPKGRV